MTEYKKKKQLIEDNEDMYFSEYDKTLSYDALSRVADAKRDFINAAKNNDKQGMTKANDVANAVRAKYGNYTGGEDGSEYHPFGYYDKGFEKYESKYEDELDALYDSIKRDTSKFNYNYEDDPVYQAYKKVYETRGNLAYDRALSENSLRTGGIANTYAQSAASQALNYYNSQLAAKIPELYEAAYDRYIGERENRYNRYKDSYDIIKSRENRDYLRYLDSLETARKNRDFNYKQQSDINDRLFQREKFEEELDAKNYAAALDNQYKLKKAELDSTADARKALYDILSDAAEDEKWRWEYNLDARKQGSPTYSGAIGNGDILQYARKIFGNENLTEEDLYRILGLQ